MPITCAAQSASCGEISDGCGGTLACGTCGSGNVCTGQHVCAPAPTACVAAQPPASLAPVTGNIRGEICQDGWCQSGASANAKLRAFWALSDCDAWAGGELRNQILHWDGSSWSWVPLPVTLPVIALWGAQSDDVWALTPPPDWSSKAVALHWNGRAWSTVELPVPVNVTLTEISGSSSKDVWAVAPEIALHWDGARWAADETWQATPADAGNAALQVFSREDAIATSPAGCQRWDGARWSETPCGVSTVRNDVWASGPNDIWVVGMAYLDYGDFVAARSHWNGQAWQSEGWHSCADCSPGSRPPAFFDRVYGYGPNDVWINDELHYDGRTWTKVGEPTGRTFAGRMNGTRFSFDESTLFQGSGSAWKPVATVTPERVARIGGDSPSEVFGLGGRGGFEVYRYQAGAWRRATNAAPFNCDPSTGGCLAVTVIGHRPTDLWAFGGTSAWHWDGAAWRRMDFNPGVNIRAGWVRSPTDAVIVGGEDGAQVGYHWDGRQWIRMTFDFGGDDIQKFWGSAPDDVWAVGHHYSGSTTMNRTGVIWHWDGRQWTRVFSDAAHATVFDISARGRSEVWALQRELNEGTGGARVLRWNGSTFVLSTTVAGGSNYPGNKLSVRGPNDIWVTAEPRWSGPFPTTPVLHFDGSAWSPAGSIPAELTSLHAVPGGGVFAADGRVFTWRGAGLR